MMNKTRRKFLIFLAVLFTLQPVFSVALPSPIARAVDNGDASTETVGDLPSVSEDESIYEESDDLQDYSDELGFYESFELLEALNADSDCLKIAPQDVNALVDGRVDVRATNYLLNLVFPKPYGEGLCPVKVGRLLKNYDTDGVGRFDRESADAVEEDARFISNHRRGQAVDISEIGSITCKLVEKRHVGGNTTRWQQPRSIKVAWQSVDGISRTPTPKSPSLMETAATLSADGILRMLNESGEMDAYVDYVRGMGLKDIMTYVGANILLKNAGALKITGDPLADSYLNVIGAIMLDKSFPGLPDGLIAQDNQESAAVAIARARLEESLNMPPGSLRGAGWDDILSNTGERVLENAVGLPTLFFEDHSLDEANSLETFRAALRHLNEGDEAFDFIDGTIDKIQKKDDEGLKMAGINMVASSFKMSDAQRDEIIAAVRQKRQPKVDPDSVSMGKEFPQDAAKLFFSENKTEQDKARAEMLEFGKEMLRQALQKSAPRQFEGVTTTILNSVLNRSEFSLDELKKNIGASKIGIDYGLNEKDIAALKKSGSTGKIEAKIADELNKDYDLEDKFKITATEVDQMLAGKNYRVAEKIGGQQADKAMGWNKGTGFAVISGDKKLADAAGEIFSNAFGQILGLEEGTEISLDGDVQNKYGRAMIEQRLGIKLNKDNAADFKSKDLLSAFGIESSKSLSELQKDASFWTDPDTVDALSYADANLGVTDGTSEKFLRGEINVDQLSRATANNNIANTTFDQLWSYFDLEERFRLEKDEGKLLFDVLKDWDNAAFEKKDQAFQLIHKLMGRSMDARTGFAIDFFVTYITTGDTGIATEMIIDQGIRQLALAFGVNLKDFDEDDLKSMTERIIKVFDGDATKLERDSLIDQLLDATNIPSEHRDDAAAFLKGDFKTGLAAWSAKIWSDFANKYLPPEAQLSYEEIRQTFDYDNQEAINDRALLLLTDGGQMEGNWGALTEEQQQEFLGQARRQLIQESRDNAQYKISDALLEQAAGQDMPANFSKTMFEGTQEQRAELLLNFGIARIESVLRTIEPSYQEGTLEKIYKGKLSARDADQLVLTIINRSGVEFGPFDSTFIAEFYQFIRSQGDKNFFTDSKYDGMWSYFDSWFEDTLGIGELPGGLARSVFFASKNGWKLDVGLKDKQGQILVPSLKELGENFLLGKVSEFGDKQFNLPAGSTFRIYQAVKSFQQAERAYAAANTAQNAANLSKAQAELTVVVITIALNACEACQQFFASIDKAIAAPPGFTNAAVAGAIAMALGLGPAGLIAAAVIYLIGVYRVDYLCPIPPPDRFALTTFDPEYDKLDYTWGDYYTDGTKVVKDNPAPGENPFDWDEGLPFADGNDPNLWRAWARYNTGLLLEKTMVYGEQRERPNKPLQVITLRQANVEYFYPRRAAVFGIIERLFPSVGMGYSQKTTKTTDWVHVGFGGWF
ncbi:MAG: hypothetical protein HZB70_03010 [Candidatus Berkelbacteria bacterium]|nr:MAG: hypothetical protein HZB70_03010 [Candidatus Berkelbacteria bacterium]QQG51726.1 MAG: hypothetical protein HY845_04180 [Candidatus Berkelbacteria bacterium]